MKNQITVKATFKGKHDSYSYEFTCNSDATNSDKRAALISTWSNRVSSFMCNLFMAHPDRINFETINQ